jgi:hypothetical protein
MAKSNGRIIALRWPESDLIEIDNWRRRQVPFQLSRPEAIRHLVKSTLSSGHLVKDALSGRSVLIGGPSVGGSLLEDIGKISIKNRKLDSCNAIAANLILQQDYKGIPLRTMRRYVTTAIDSRIRALKKFPPGYWQEIGIEQPSEMTKRTLVKKALEDLRWWAETLERVQRERDERKRKELTEPF